jgi:hypothetical protein
MKSTRQDLIAQRYFVNDLLGAERNGTRLNGILRKIDAHETLSIFSLQFLEARGLNALYQLGQGTIGLMTFQAVADMERTKRIRQSELLAAQQAVDLARLIEKRDAAIRETFAAIANDPELRRKREAKELRHRFGIGYIEPEHYQRVMPLLRKISNNRRIQLDDVAWLQAEVEYCWTDSLQKAWHTLEAQFLTKAWETRNDPWDAVNASAHWRRAGNSDFAVELTASALKKKGLAPKLKSALTTTRGGALRDLHRLDEAKMSGLAAHDLTPKDFRPCTLLGAVCIELGDLAAGHGWYVDAEKRGATSRSIDQELRSLLSRALPDEQGRIREFLVAQDPKRFSWLSKWQQPRRSVNVNSR